MPPFCEKHQIHYVYGYVSGLPWKTCFCEKCESEKSPAFNPLPKAIKTTELPSKAAAVEGILTEEELKFYEENALGTNYWNMTDALQSVIASHRNLLSANAELSFKNEELRKTIDHQHILLDKYESKLNGGI